MVGQQKLMVIAISSVVASIGILVGLTLFKSNAVTSNRDELISSLMTLGAKARMYYIRPASMSGGGHSFRYFQLTPSDTGNATGSYSCSHKKPKNTKYVAGSIEPVKSREPIIYIVGCGTEIGTNHKDVVKVYIEVTQNSMVTKILN